MASGLGGCSFSSRFNVGHVNINSLTNKISEVRSLLISNNVDLLGISESWLTCDIPDSLVSIGNYNIIRNDTPGNIKKHGVEVYIKSISKFEIVDCGLNNVVIFHLSDLDTYVITVYRPPLYTDI